MDIEEVPALYPELNKFNEINRRQVMRTCPTTGRLRRTKYFIVEHQGRSTKYKVKGRKMVMKSKYQVRDWLRERGLPIIDAEDRIRQEDGFNANFSVIDDPAASLECEEEPTPLPQQQVKHELEGGGEILEGGARHTDERQQGDEISGHGSEGASSYWGIEGFSALVRDCPPVDSDVIRKMDLSNDVDLFSDINDEVTSPLPLPLVVSGEGTRSPVVLGQRRHFLAASIRYFLRVVGGANEQLRGCNETRQQMLQELIGSNTQSVMEVQRCILP